MKILVHLHLYYQEMLDEMLAYVANLSGYDYDLVVTAAGLEPAAADRLQRFNPGVRIMEVENRGYDVAPFVKVLKAVNLDEYDYVIKIHTKQNLKSRAWLPDCSFVGDEWRRLLLSFMDSPDKVRKVLGIFAAHPKVGMISHYNLIIAAAAEDREANRRAEEIMTAMRLVPGSRRFVAGTMFIARARLLKPLREYPCATEDFELYNKDVPGGSLAHVYERLFGYVITAQGYDIASYAPETHLIRLGHLLRRLALFLVRVKINGKNKMVVKICKIPVYSGKLKS